LKHASQFFGFFLGDQMLFDRYDGSFLTVVIHETAPDIWGFWSPYFGQKVFVIRFPTFVTPVKNSVSGF